MFKERRNPDTKIVQVKQLMPTIFISTTALIKMQHFVMNCADEVGWMGTAIKDGNEYHINDVFLFDQEVHATTTEITPSGLADFGMKLLEEHPEQGMDIWNSIRMWGHSHVNMGVTPSVQDDSQMRTFAEGGHPWFIRLIANKKGDMKLDLFDYQLGASYIDVPWIERYEGDIAEVYEKIDQLYGLLDELRDQQATAFKDIILAEMAVKVRKKSYSYHGNNTNKSWWNKNNTGGMENGTKLLEQVPNKKKEEKETNETNVETTDIILINEFGELKGSMVLYMYDVENTYWDYFDIQDAYMIAACTKCDEVRDYIKQYYGFMRVSLTDADLKAIWLYARFIVNNQFVTEESARKQIIVKGFNEK